MREKEHNVRVQREKEYLMYAKGMKRAFIPFCMPDTAEKQEAGTGMPSRFFNGQGIDSFPLFA